MIVKLKNGKKKNIKKNELEKGVHSPLKINVIRSKKTVQSSGDDKE